MLTDAANPSASGMDGWRVLGGGSLDAIAFDGENPALTFNGIESSWDTDCYAGHPLGTTLRSGEVTVDVDIRPPRGWPYADGATYVRFGGDGHMSREAGFLSPTTIGFGFKCTSSTQYYDEYNGLYTNSTIVAYSGNLNGGGEFVSASAVVFRSHWYRFVATMRMGENKYDVAVYDMGEVQPALETRTPSEAIATFSNLSFRSDKSAIGGISCVSVNMRGIRCALTDETAQPQVDNIRLTHERCGFVLLLR